MEAEQAKKAQRPKAAQSYALKLACLWIAHHQVLDPQKTEAKEIVGENKLEATLLASFGDFRGEKSSGDSTKSLILLLRRAGDRKEYLWALSGA